MVRAGATVAADSSASWAPCSRLASAIWSWAPTPATERGATDGSPSIALRAKGIGRLSRIRWTCCWRSPAAPLLNSSNRIDPNPAHLAFHGQTALPGEGIGGREPGSTAMMNAPYLRRMDGLECDGWGAETTAEHPGESPSRRWQAGWLAERLRREDPARSCRVIDSDEVCQGLPTQHA